MLGIAQTGTSKTGAFALPVPTNSVRGPRKYPPPAGAGSGADTRLAIQIGEEFEAYAAQMKLRQTVIFGEWRTARSVR